MLLQRSETRRRRGLILVLVAFSMIILLSVLALSLDGGGLLAERRNVQGAADAAALAAASDLYQYYYVNNGEDPANTARDSALLVALQNGYAEDTPTSTVTVNIPPKSGDYTNKRGYVEVIIVSRQQRNFSRVFGSDSLPIQGRAVALGAAVAADVGILVLDPADKGAFSSQGSGTSDVKNTPIVVNSNHNEAAIAGGGGSVKADDFYITGNYTTSGGGAFTGDIHTGRSGLPDPLADVPVPDAGTMTTQANNKTQYTQGTHALQPGVYKGGISVSGTGSLNLAPGVYYMDGGGFSFSGQGSLVGNGVMIYNAPGNGQSAGISVTGQGSMILSAPTSGKYKGITFFQDRTANVTGNVEGTGGQTSITGTFYFAGALLKVSGNGGVANIGSQYISNKLELGGNGGINIDWGPDKVAPKRSIYLVE